MRRNVAGQVISAQLNSSTDGSAVTTGTTTVYVTGDGGTQSSGGGTVAHEGNGCWSYAPTQAETNYDHVAFTFVNSSAIAATVNVYPTSLDPTDAVRAGLTALPNAAADAAGGLPVSDAGGLDLDTLLGRLDAAISSRLAASGVPTNFEDLAITATTGRVDVGTIEGVDATDQINTAADTALVDFFTSAAQLVDDIWDEAQSGHVAAGSFGEIATEIATLLSRLSSARAGYLDNLSVGVVAQQATVDAIEIDTQDIQSRLPATLVSGRIDASIGAMQAAVITAAVFGASAIDAAALATDAVEEIADQVWDESQAAHVSAGSFGVIASEIASCVTDLTTLLSRLSAARAGYLDTLDDQQQSVIVGQVTATVTPTTTSVSTDLTGYATDELIGRTIIFHNDASGAPGFTDQIVGYSATNGVITWSDAAQSAPVSGDNFSIV